MGRTARATLAAIIAFGALSAAACGSDEAPTPKPTAGTVTETIAKADASQAEKIAVIRLCKQVITSAGVMVRDYNAFISRLNDTQDYATIGSDGQWAVETLNTGADLVRKAVAPDVPARVDGQVQSFVASSERLAEQIAGKRRQSLNPVSGTWAADRTALLDTCSEYLPAGG